MNKLHICFSYKNIHEVGVYIKDLILDYLEITTPVVVLFGGPQKSPCTSV